MPVNRYGGLSTDTTLGGVSPSDEIVPSQKALKTYIDNHSGWTPPSQTGHAGEFLGTDGTTTSWSSIPADSNKANIDMNNLSTVGQNQIVSLNRNYVTKNLVIAEGNSFSIQGDYTLGFTDGKVKLGIFQYILSLAYSAGVTSMGVSTDVINPPQEVVATNNGFTTRGYIMIPFINRITLTFPEYSAGISYGRLFFVGYM